MERFLRLPPALLAALPLLFGPAAWAIGCDCGAACAAAETAAACPCGPAGCGGACCETPAETPAGPTRDCDCGCEPLVPLLPVATTAEPVPVPAAPALPATRRIAADDLQTVKQGVGEPDPAASPPARVRLCVWRN